MFPILICLCGGASFAFLVWFYFEYESEKIWFKNLGRATSRKRTVVPQREGARLNAELADFLDLMALGISSGLNMENAWALGTHHTRPGLLKKELVWVQDALFLGRPREEAFQELDRRLGQDSLHLFFAILVQSVRAGSRLQNLFHDQASALRRARLFRLERRAQTAPLRLLLPLFLFIFPTIFLILFGPLAIRLSQGVSLF